MNFVGAFSPVEAIHVATVLEDCVDQLVILGRIMPVSFREKPNAVQIVDEELAQLIESQKTVEGSFDNAILQRQGSGSHRTFDMRDDPRVAPIGVSSVQKAGVELRRSTQGFAQALKQNPLTADNMEKVQADRAFVESVLHGTMSELLNRGSFETLAKAVRSEQDKRTQLEQTIQREEDGRKMVKQLQRQLVEVKREREVELQRRTEMIAHLKDQLQEMKAKTNMEGKYVKNVKDVSVAQTQKRCAQEEDQIRSEIEALKNRIDEENRVNAEIESFLRTHIQKRQDLLQYWIDKHENDVDLKQKELDLLKAAKAKDFERLQELKRLYNEYEQVVIEDRVEKEKIRRKAEQEADEQEAAILLQAWWLGVMVRRCLGPYKKKKKKGGKGKGKKGEKGKKKGKKK